MSKKVLIVDDDASIRDLYVHYFPVKGYETVGAANGEKGLEVLKREKIDLVVLDLAMPGLQGEEVMQQMADHPEWRKIPIIVETAVGFESGRPQKVRERFAGKLRFEIFQRPSSLDKLEQAISELILL